MMAKIELYNDNYANWKSYNIPAKAQLVIADIPYQIGNNAYGSDPRWYNDGDNKRGKQKKMTNKEKFWYLIGPAIMSFVFSATSPIIHVYFVSLIEPRIVAAASLIGTGLSALVNYTIPIDRMKELYRKNFLLIVLTDVILFALISFFGCEYPEVRFMGFSFLNAVSTCLWVMVMRNVANRIIGDGDERTDFDAMNNYTTFVASFLGGIIAVIFVRIPVEYCIAAQCVANLIMGITDVYSFRMLKRAYKSDF